MNNNLFMCRSMSGIMRGIGIGIVDCCGFANHVFNHLESLGHIFKKPALIIVKLESRGHLAGLHTALLARHILAIRAERYLVNVQLLYSSCCLQGNPVAIAGHLLPVTHHLVDPHCSCHLDKTRFGITFSLLTFRSWQSI